MGHGRPFRLSPPPRALGQARGARDRRLVPVRDSKRPEGPVLVLPASAWTPFVESVKAS
ncbi:MULTISPECIES: DUF397 domain-containing protein [unclassified Streptomyces]|uniref:DUF397 domain-containing protein n=1 Tax=unclassified Streptomyces TaxID=2593676 RepID=UPI003805C4B7